MPRETFDLHAQGGFSHPNYCCKEANEDVGAAFIVTVTTHHKDRRRHTFQSRTANLVVS